jgi:hypothetical protein
MIWRSARRTASPQAMPSSWRMPLNADSRSFRHRRSLRMTALPRFKRLRLRSPLLSKAQNQGKRRASTRASSPLRRHGVKHLRSIAQQPCLICGRKPSDPHHLRYLQPRALGRKASDEFAVPLCRVHHRAVHRARDERAWWQTAGIDPIKIARKLWKDTRIDEGRVEPGRTPQAAAADRASQPGGDAAETQAPA